MYFHQKGRISQGVFFAARDPAQVKLLTSCFLFFETIASFKSFTLSSRISPLRLFGQRNAKSCSLTTSSKAASEGCMNTSAHLPSAISISRITLVGQEELPDTMGGVTLHKKASSGEFDGEVSLEWSGFLQNLEKYTGFGSGDEEVADPLGSNPGHFRGRASVGPALTGNEQRREGMSWTARKARKLSFNSSPLIEAEAETGRFWRIDTPIDKFLTASTEPLSLHASKHRQASGKPTPPANQQSGKINHLLKAKPAAINGRKQIDIQAKQTQTSTQKKLASVVLAGSTQAQGASAAGRQSVHASRLDRLPLAKRASDPKLECKASRHNHRSLASNAMQPIQPQAEAQEREAQGGKLTLEGSGAREGVARSAKPPEQEQPTKSSKESLGEAQTGRKSKLATPAVKVPLQPIEEGMPLDFYSASEGKPTAQVQSSVTRAQRHPLTSVKTQPTDRHLLRPSLVRRSLVKSWADSARPASSVELALRQLLPEQRPKRCHPSIGSLPHHHRASHLATCREKSSQDLLLDEPSLIPSLSCDSASSRVEPGHFSPTGVLNHRL